MAHTRAEQIEETLDDCCGSWTVAAHMHLARMTAPVGPFRVVVVHPTECWKGHPYETTPFRTESDMWLVVDPCGPESSSLVYSGTTAAGTVRTHTLQGGDVFHLDDLDLMVQNITRCNIEASHGPSASAGATLVRVPVERVAHIFAPTTPPAREEQDGTCEKERQDTRASE